MSLLELCSPTRCRLADFNWKEGTKDSVDALSANRKIDLIMTPFIGAAMVLLDGRETVRERYKN